MMDIIKKDGTTERSRYFERTTMFVKYASLRFLVVTKLVSTRDMMADIFTKCVDKDTFLRMRRYLLNLDGETSMAAAYKHVTRMLHALQETMRML